MFWGEGSVIAGDRPCHYNRGKPQLGGYAVSDLNRSLVNHSLAACGVPFRRMACCVCTTLPQPQVQIKCRAPAEQLLDADFISVVF